MTTNKKSTWQNAEIYINPDVYDTPEEARPNNVVGTVSHFSKPVTLRKYTNPEDWQCDGLPIMGAYESIEFWCVIRPLTSGMKTDVTRMDVGGEYSEGKWALYYNPYHHKHKEDGIHLQLSDEYSEYGGFSDVIEHQDELWRVREHKRLDIDYGNSYKDYIGKAIIEKWKEPAHTANSQEKTISHYSLK